MLKTTRLILFAPVLAMLVTSLGCSSIPKARRYIRDAEKADEVGNRRVVLENMETVTDIFPGELTKERRAEVLAMYRRNQIAYGTAQSSRAERNGDLIEAWVWAVQTSAVEPDNPECVAMDKRAEELYAAISADLLEQATASLASNARQDAFAAAIRSTWYGSGERAIPLLTAITGDAARAKHLSEPEVIHEQGVRGLVRTDSIEQFGAQKPFAPYGLPVFFGDIPRYYKRLGKVKVEGTPIPRKLPQAYSKVDSLFRLTKKAQRLNADAIINVHIWTTRKKVTTIGEAVRFADLPREGTESRPLQLSTELSNQ